MRPYHESDLDLEEHYTDTHGYTEINFAAFVMVGMRFCPRIRSLHRRRIYCADPDRDHGVLEHAQQIAGHRSPKTTKLYDRTADTVTVGEIERIVI